MPLKSVKRGIKLWFRSDSFTGYAYDFNIYTGRETESLNGTLGVRVMNKLISQQKRKVPFALIFFFYFDHSTTDVAAGHCNQNRKSLPKINDKLKRLEYVFKCTKDELLFVK